MPVRKVRDVPEHMADRLIVALDVSSPKAAGKLVEQLDGTASFFKIGLQLLFADGTERLISDLVGAGKRVFLDYKMFDIPETVKQGVARARDRGISFVTVHGNKSIMRAAVEGKGGRDDIKVFAITVLTSLNQGDVEDELGYRISIPELIRLRVENALECGCDGVIASAADQPNHIRHLVGPRGDGLLIATPGIRDKDAPADDQKRRATPAEAIRDGADYIVVGRPIIGEPDPNAAAKAIIAEMMDGKAAAEAR